jgi:polysaccharide export outer membrane protein
MVTMYAIPASSAFAANTYGQQDSPDLSSSGQPLADKPATQSQGAPDMPPASSPVSDKVKGTSSSMDLLIPITPDQTIQSGDGLFISVSPAEELSRDILVDANGKVSIPLIGSIQAAGLTAEELARKISHALSRYVTNPKVDVFLKQSMAKQLGISGQVTLPGSYPYRTNMHLLDVISLAGGFLPSANRKQVRILRRSGVERKIIPVDADAIMANEAVNKDVLLEPGDLVEVPRGMTGVSVFGSVMSPGVYEYMYDMRMLDLISLCHGFLDGASQHDIRVIRGEGPTQQTIVVSFSKVVKDRSKYNLLLQPGDVVFVPQRSLWTFSTVATTFSPIATLVLAGAAIFLAVHK